MSTKSLIYAPPIIQVPDNFTRPLWSVMIPTYNGMAYLEQTLRSVLEQAPGPDQMQIEVVDDCSTQGNPEALVKDIGQGRILFFRNPQNVGLVNNWNVCIQRAYGQWIHILHQDDIVLAGFYRQFQEVISTDQSIGAAFCRHVFMDEEGHWQDLSTIESRKPGILEKWIHKLAVAQRIQFPSIVVKRSVYEELGGFCQEVHYAADWEMWKRIASHYPFWFEPQVLACYRQHLTSETSRLVKTASDIIDIRKSIELSKTYLPSEEVDELTRQAQEYYTLYALNTAKKMAIKHEFNIAISQIKEALKYRGSPRIFIASLRLFGSFGKHYFLHKITQPISFLNSFKHTFRQL